MYAYVRTLFQGISTAPTLLPPSAEIPIMWAGGWEAGVWERELHGRAPSSHPLNEMWAWEFGFFAVI